MLDREKEKLGKTKYDLIERLISGNLPTEIEDEIRYAIKRVQERLEQVE